MAALPAEHAGHLLRWGMRRYADGFGISVEDAKIETAMDDRSWATLIHLVRPLLDAEALDAGTIVVTPFARAAENLAKVSASKVRRSPVSRERAAEVIAIAAARASGGTTRRMGKASLLDDSSRPVEKRKVAVAEAAPADGGPWEMLAATLESRGVPLAEVDEALSRWKEAHSSDDVLQALQNVSERRIARPVKYLDTVFSNMRSARVVAMPSAIKAANEGHPLPRPVKRKIHVGPRSGWTFEGWTAKAHPRGGEEVVDRRQVWRNDSGTLSYKMPDPEDGKPVPTYEEDPGVYEAD